MSLEAGHSLTKPLSLRLTNKGYTELQMFESSTNHGMRPCVFQRGVTREEIYATQSHGLVNSDGWQQQLQRPECVHKMNSIHTSTDKHLYSEEAPRISASPSMALSIPFRIGCARDSEKPREIAF